MQENKLSLTYSVLADPVEVNEQRALARVNTNNEKNMEKKSGFNSYSFLLINDFSNILANILQNNIVFLVVMLLSLLVYVNKSLILMVANKETYHCSISTHFKGLELVSL